MIRRLSAPPGVDHEVIVVVYVPKRANPNLAVVTPPVLGFDDGIFEYQGGVPEIDTALVEISVTFSPELELSYVAGMTRESHAIETRFRSLFELRSRYPALPDDGQQRADRELAVVWNGNRDAAGLGAALHDDMTSTPAHLDEPVPLKNPTDFASRQDAKPTHASLRSSLQKHQSEAGA